MQLLSEKVGLVCEEKIGTFDLAKVEAQCTYFLGRDSQRIDIWADIISEVLSGLDGVDQGLLLFGLEWKHLELVVPILELF